MPVTPPDELTIRWDETAERTVGVGDLARTRPELVAHHRRDKAKRKPASGPRGKPPEPKPKPNASTTYGGSSGSCGRRAWPTTRNGGRNGRRLGRSGTSSRSGGSSLGPVVSHDKAQANIGPIAKRRRMEVRAEERQEVLSQVDAAYKHWNTTRAASSKEATRETPASSRSRAWTRVPIPFGRPSRSRRNGATPDTSATLSKPWKIGRNGRRRPANEDEADPASAGDQPRVARFGRKHPTTHPHNINQHNPKA